MCCVILYCLYDLANVKNIKIQPATILKVTLHHGCFSRSLNCANYTKSLNASHMSYDSKGIEINSFLVSLMVFEKTGFLVFSLGIRWEHWPEMV